MRQFLKKSHRHRKQKIARVAAALLRQQIFRNVVTVRLIAKTGCHSNFYLQIYPILEVAEEE